MKPGVVRSLVGLAGDLITDPISYVGAPAVGLKVAAKGGQTVSVGLRGSRDLLGGIGREGAIKAVKRGGLAAVKQGATRDLLEAAAKTAAPGLDNAALASHLSGRILGAPTQGRLGRAFSRVGGALEHEGGILSKVNEFGLAGQLDDEAKAARAFIAEYGSGAGPGLRLGKGATRAVAHVPFTDIGIYVPAFTDKAKYAADTLKVARDRGPVDPMAARGVGVAAAAERTQKIRDIETAIRDNNMPIKGLETQEVPDAVIPAGTGFDAWRNRLWDGVKAGQPFKDEPAIYRAMSEAEYQAGIKSGVFKPIIGNDLFVTRDPDRLAGGAYGGKGGGYIVEFADQPTKKIPSRTAAVEEDAVDSLPATSIRRVFKHDPATGDHIAQPITKTVPIHATPDDLLAEADDHLRELEKIINGGPVNGRPIAPATPSGIGELLSLKRLVEQAESARDAAAARVAEFADPKHPGALAGEAVKNAEERLARATEGAARNWAGADPEKMRIVQRLVGTDDPVVGSSTLGTLARAASRFRDGGVAAELLHRGDQTLKGTFGQSQGMLRSMWRYLQNTMTTGRRERYISLEHELRGKVLDAMESAGLDRTIEDYRKAAAVTVAHMAMARNEEARIAAQQAASLAGDVVAAPTDLRFFLTDHNTGEPLQWVKDLEAAQKSGYFSKQHGNGLHDALRRVAVENNRMLDELGSVELTDEILGRQLEGYLPNAATEGARARMAAQKEYAVKRGLASGRSQGQMAQEGFQKERSTHQYRFIGNDGKPKRFFEMDRWAATFTPEELADLAKDNPDDAKYVEELGNAIREWDLRAKDPEWAAANASRNTHPAEMNQLARDGRFKLILGGDPIPGGDFMDTNVGTMMAARAMAHESAVARKDWLDYTKQFGVAVDPAKFQGHALGTDFVMKDGTVAKTFREPISGKPGVEILGQRYRPLSASFAGKNNPLLQAIGDDSALLYHEDVARLLEESGRVYEQQGPELLKFLDTATAAWKTQSLMHPSWTVANLVGDTMNYLTGGVRLPDLAKNAGPMAQIFRNIENPAELRKITLNIRGVPVSGEKFINDLRSQRLMGNNRMAETVLQLMNRKLVYMPSHTRPGKTGWGGIGQALDPRTIGQDVSKLKGSFLQDISHQSAYDRLAAGAKASGFVARERLVKGVISPWFRANEVMQDYMRAMAYASFLEQGHDIPMAVRKTIDAGFDYADLTRVERTVFRRIFPFYSWMRNNGAYQLKLLMDRPIYTGMYPLLLNAAEEAINGDQEVPLHARPGWMRNQLGLMVGKDPNRQALMLGSGLPVEQSLVALEPLLGGPDGVQDFLKYFATGTNTFLRSPVEIGVGREFFTDRTIGATGDIGKLEYVANQFRPFREVNKIGEVARKQGTLPAVGRFLLGGRVQGADDERLRISRLKEFKVEEEQLRRAIASAGYNSGFQPDTPEFNAASVKPRAKQLALYRDMVTAGFEADVPVWARTQLGQLAAGPPG